MQDLSLPKLPQWATDPSASVLEPDLGKQVVGWIPPVLSPATPGEKPRADHMNWLMRQTYLAQRHQRGADRRRLLHCPDLSIAFGLPNIFDEYPEARKKDVFIYATGISRALIFDGRRVHVGAAEHNKVLLVPEQTVSAGFVAPTGPAISESAVFDGTSMYRVGGAFIATQYCYKYDPATLAVVWESSALMGLSHPGGAAGPTLAYAHSCVYVGDWINKKLFKIDTATGYVLATISLTVSPRSLAYDGTYLWAFGSNTETSFDRIDAAGVVVNTTGSPWDSPNAGCFDGETLWVANNTWSGSASSLIGMDPDTGLQASPARQITFTGNPKIVNLFFDGKYIWGQTTASGLYRADPEGGDASWYCVVPDQLATIGVQSMTFDGTHLWVVTNPGSDNYVRRILAS